MCIKLYLHCNSFVPASINNLLKIEIVNIYNNSGSGLLNTFVNA